jgi:hypothetical protein
MLQTCPAGAFDSKEEKTIIMIVIKIFFID